MELIDTDRKRSLILTDTGLHVPINQNRNAAIMLSDLHVKFVYTAPAAREEEIPSGAVSQTESYSGTTRVYTQDDVSKLMKAKTKYQWLVLGWAALMIGPGLILSLVFLGNLTINQQKRWLVALLESFILSAIIAAPILFTIVAVRRTHLSYRKFTSGESDASHSHASV